MWNAPLLTFDGLTIAARSPSSLTTAHVELSIDGIWVSAPYAGITIPRRLYEPFTYLNIPNL